MKTMLVGICYNTDGTRYINELLYTSWLDALELDKAAQRCKKHNDEVYIIDLNPSHKEFIEEIVFHGCRK